ncbi:MAG: glycosyltransferase family 4 protein [Ferruginibacter sp.]
MKKLNISIILPYPVTKPSGGPKIMYEYANKLSGNGHRVTIYHSIKRPYKKSNTPLFVKRMVYALRGIDRPAWFPLEKNIRSIIVPSITDKYIADADIVLSTWWQMAYAVDRLASSKGEKFNLIQDYEIWNGRNELVDQSFCLGVKNIVIAKYLQELVYKKSGIMPTYLPNAIDTGKFFVSANIAERNDHSVIMLYSDEPRKGTQYGLDALYAIQKTNPDLQVTLFGVYPKPPVLPGWITYHHKPGNLPELYNSAAIFFSPSLTEGWALPPAEAMACGCAVVCTNIGGHADYAFENETALLVEPKHVSEMVDTISILLNDVSLRNKLAQNGSSFIVSKFSWDKNLQKLEALFYQALEKNTAIKTN